MKWVCLLIAILTEVVATGALKASHSFSRLGPSLLTVAGYLVAFYCLNLTLREMPGGALRMRSGAAWVRARIAGRRTAVRAEARYGGDRRHGADHKPA